VPKKKEPDLTPEEQFKRFEEAAEEHGIEEMADQIDRAFREIASPKPEKPKKPKSR
jgi:hypothetical protein